MNLKIKHTNSDPDYRFGFNGMLRDDDVRDKNAPIFAEEGLGNSYDFGARIYDPRAGRWLSLDPLMSKYPSVSSYIFTLNNPINFIDPDGRVVIFINGQHDGNGGTSAYWNGWDKKVIDKIQDYHTPIYRDGASGGWGNTFYTNWMKSSVSSISGQVLSALNNFEEGLKRGIVVNQTIDIQLPEVNSNNLYIVNRYNAGASQGIADAFSIFQNLESNESIKVITHSMGTAYARGYVNGVLSQVDKWNELNPNNKIDSKTLFEMEVDVSPFPGVGIMPKIEGVKKAYQMSNWWMSDYPGYPLDDKKIESLPIPFNQSHAIETFPVKDIPKGERNGTKKKE